MKRTNPLHDPGGPDSHWATDNVGEAAPGVLSPLGASIWALVGDRTPRQIAYEIGVFAKAEGSAPRSDEDRIVRLFYGRLAMRMEYLAAMGDRMPGTSGAEAVSGMHSRVPDSLEFAPTRRRYPSVAYKLPRAMLASPGRVRKLAPEVDAWWCAQIPRLKELDQAEATALLASSITRFQTAITLHSLAIVSAVQPLMAALTKLVERAGVGDVGTLSGSGGAEMAIVGDLWKASRGQVSLADVIANHGFHGPLEGEVSSRVWRENPQPLERLIGEYARQDDSRDPVQRDQLARTTLPDRQREVLAALPRRERPTARLLLARAASTILVRGVGKRSFLQSLDVARGAARRIGDVLASDGRLELPDDVFYLTRQELAIPLAPDARDLIAWRRERRAEYEGLRLPVSWKGIPHPKPTEDESGDSDDTGVNGVGVSTGVTEGTVRVVSDPSFADVEPGEVLVAPTTDPSWASIMFLSSALVVDIGGPLSHAAVVARELGVPCVVNTRNGTRVLHSGDRVRVDGTSGKVEVLERVPEEPLGKK